MPEINVFLFIQVGQKVRLVVDTTTTPTHSQYPYIGVIGCYFYDTEDASAFRFLLGCLFVVSFLCLSVGYIQSFDLSSLLSFISFFISFFVSFIDFLILL